MQQLKEKVVLISGALGDIGMAIATAYLRTGHAVSFCDIEPEEKALQRLHKLQGTFEYHKVDVSDATAVANWIAAVLERFGRIDDCIVNAAKVTLKDYRNITPEAWKRELEVNLNGAFYLANAAARYFSKAQVAGNIVFLGSWAAHAVHKNLPAYSVSKAGLRMLCQSMALEYAPYGIRVNELAPGYVNAGLSKEVWSTAPDLQEAARNQVPLKRIIEAREVADQVLWITAPENRHLTGATILLDGGLSLIRP
ncbi:SDR family NAD(P)-dependent oxidoreductase [Niabella hirudinis]|uniref:SDR family NAD(P)-dependent oxidoreductase n=1 Tax=Niabella hirudinis TaxID=1285929 RepID=UPI003EB8FAB0